MSTHEPKQTNEEVPGPGETETLEKGQQPSRVLPSFSYILTFKNKHRRATTFCFLSVAASDDDGNASKDKSDL